MLSSDEGWETRIKTFVYLSSAFRGVTNLFKSNNLTIYV